MKRFLIIGKSATVEPLYLSNEKGGFDESRLPRGAKLEVTEAQLNFHVKRRAARGAIQILELEDIPEPVVVEEPKPVDKVVIEEKVSDVEPDEEEEFMEPVEETPAVVVEESDESGEDKPTPRRKYRHKKKKTEPSNE
jgi:hypothetical protein